jgi:hypothetical protein
MTYDDHDGHELVAASGRRTSLPGVPMIGFLICCNCPAIVGPLPICGEPTLKGRPWIDRSNEPRAGLELLADTVEFVGRRQAEDDADEPVRASVVDERSDRRRTPESVAAAGARGAVGRADRDDNLEALPF